MRCRNFFDRVLVDAPCSGEGMFRKEPVARQQHCEALVKQCAELGAEILDCAAAVLAPGGQLVYSTCTFDEEENEGTIRYLLERFPDMKPFGASPGGGLFSGHRSASVRPPVPPPDSGGRAILLLSFKRIRKRRQKRRKKMQAAVQMTAREKPEKSPRLWNSWPEARRRPFYPPFQENSPFLSCFAKKTAVSTCCPRRLQSLANDREKASGFLEPVCCLAKSRRDGSSRPRLWLWPLKKKNIRL